MRFLGHPRRALDTEAENLDVYPTARARRDRPPHPPPERQRPDSADQYGLRARAIAALVRQSSGQVATTSCPRDVPLRKGVRTVCSLRGRDGTRASATMVQVDGNGRVRVSANLMHTAVVEQRITGDASAKLGVPVRVDCPDLVEIATGSTLRCTATDRSGARAPVLVTVTDANGSFTYRIPPRR